MAHSNGSVAPWKDVSTAVNDRLGGMGLIAILGASVLGVAVGGPEWLGPRYVTAAVMLLAGLLIVGHFLELNRSITESAFEAYRVGIVLLLLIVLLGVLYRSGTPGYGLGPNRAVATTIVFVVLIAFCVLAGDPRQYSNLQWLVIGCLATVLGIFFYHGLAFAEASGQARQPLWWGSIMAIGLVVIPQYLSRAQFLWAINRFAAGLILLSLPVYIVGEFTLFGLSFTFHEAYTIPLLDHQVQATRSLFAHRNAFATVVFAGLVAAVAEFHQAYLRERPVGTLIVPGVLLGINAIGLAVSYGRALWVTTPMAVGVYFAYAVFGRQIVPIAVVAGFSYLLGGIAAVQSGILPLPEGTPTRVLRWYPAIEAILDSPSLLGEGLIDPGLYIAPYQGGAEYSPHNSYLTMTIRAGLLGGLAYVVLIVTSLLAGLRATQAEETNIPASVGLLALGVGYTAHQLFEAYTLFNWNSSTVVAVLVFGFLVFGGVERTIQSSGSVGVDASNDITMQSTDRSDASRTDR